MVEEQDNYKKLGKQRFCNFCRAIKKLIQEKNLDFDLLVAAGNSGQSLAKFTELIFQELNQEAPPKLLIPFFRYFPGYRDDPGKIFDSNIFLPEVIQQVKNINRGITNVLFVDDEIGLGLTATNIFSLLNQALSEIGKPKVKDYCIVAEDQGFRVPRESPEIKFVPYDFETDGYNNVIFFINPWQLERPIIDTLGEDDKFPFHCRTNILLGLPIKDFNYGRPIYTDRFQKIAEGQISNLRELQKKYLAFIRQSIKDCLMS